MTLTTAQIVRGRLQTPWRRASETRLGDGTASAFQLQQGSPYSTVVSATASIVTTAGWSATGCSVDANLGYVTFSGRISANSAIQFDYLWSVFSDDEIGYFTAVGGSVSEAALEGIRWLMGDAAKRNRWGAPDGTTVDDTKTLDNLAKLYDLLDAEDKGAPEGGYASWSVEQENW